MRELALIISIASLLMLFVGVFLLMAKEDNNRWTDLFVVMMALGILVPHLFIWFWIVAK